MIEYSREQIKEISKAIFHRIVDTAYSLCKESTNKCCVTKLYRKLYKLNYMIDNLVIKDECFKYENEKGLYEQAKQYVTIFEHQLEDFGMTYNRIDSIFYDVIVNKNILQN